MDELLGETIGRQQLRDATALPPQMCRECAMNAYRLYLLDNAGHIRGPAIELTATDDEAAIEAATLQGEGPMELWQRERLVQRFEASRKEA